MKYLHQDERFAHSYADLYGAMPSESNSTGRLVTQPQWRTSTEEVGLANKDASKAANKDADSSDDDSSMCHHLTPFALSTWDAKHWRKSNLLLIPVETLALKVSIRPLIIMYTVVKPSLAISVDLSSPGWNGDGTFSCVIDDHVCRDLIIYPKNGYVPSKHWVY